MPVIPEQWFHLSAADGPYKYQRGDRIWVMGQNPVFDDVGGRLPVQTWVDIPLQWCGVRVEEVDQRLLFVAIRKMPSCVEMNVHNMPADALSYSWDILPFTATFQTGDMRYQLDNEVGLPGKWRMGPKDNPLKPRDPLYGQTLPEAQLRLPKMGILAFARRRPIPTCDFRRSAGFVPFGIAELEQRFILSDGTDMWTVPPSPEDWPLKAHID